MLDTIFPIVLGSLSPSMPAATTATFAVQEEADNVHWKGTEWSTKDLPEDLPEAVRDAVSSWASWAGRKEYRTEIEPEGRVIFLTHSESKKRKKDLELIDKGIASFDALLPAPERTAEDSKVREAAWGFGQLVPDRDPVALVKVQDSSDYNSLLDQMAETNPSLSGWVTSARGRTGFVNSPSQAGAWLEAPEGIEIGDVWRSDNELVNRLTQLLFYRRFGEQPYWLRTAIAWHVEQEVVGSIYSFPGRNEFVGIGEHSGWENELKSKFKKRVKKKHLEFSEFADWERGTWDMHNAQVTWGLVRYLAKFHPGALSAVAEDIRKHFKKHSVIDHDDGTWEFVPGYEVPMDVQEEILKKHAGEDVFQHATEFFAKGKRYKPKKKRR